MKMQIIENKDAYSLERKFIVTFGISHIAYGSTPEQARDNAFGIINRITT